MLNPRLLLAVLPSTIEAPVQVPDPLVEFVVVLYKHPISHHLLLADAPLQLVPPPASQPLGPHDEVLRVDLEVTQDPHVVVDPEQGPFFRPPIDLLGLRRLLDAEGPGEPRQGRGEGHGEAGPHGPPARPADANAPLGPEQGRGPT